MRAHHTWMAGTCVWNQRVHVTSGVMTQSCGSRESLVYAWCGSVRVECSFAHRHTLVHVYLHVYLQSWCIHV
jgi:hypothetical protein